MHDGTPRQAAPYVSRSWQIDTLPERLEVNDYDPIAAVYEAVMGRDCAALILPRHLAFVQARYPKRARLRHVDLACGSGSFLTGFIEALTTESYGVDLSEGQLQEARTALEAARLTATLIRGDVLHVALPRDCDVVTMNLDALNHLRSAEEWTLLFEHVFDSLRPGGVFLFDVNTQRRLLDDWSHPEVVIKESHVYVQCPFEVEFDAPAVRRRILMVVFSGQGLFERREALIEQIALPNAMLEAMLRRVGFVSVAMEEVGGAEGAAHVFMRNRLFVAATK